jgi:hypothetical protein
VVRVEFVPSHPRHGVVLHVGADGMPVRTEFAAHHESHGQILHHEGGRVVRKEFAVGHPQHGHIAHYGEDGIVTRVVDTANHPTAARIVCPGLTPDGLKRFEFEEGHKWHREIHLHDPDSLLLVRKQFAEGHSFHGHVRHFAAQRHVHTEFEASHPWHGEVRFFEHGRHVRTEFASGHPSHGELHHFRRGRLVCRAFTTTHPRHGETCYLAKRRGSLSRIVYSADHPRNDQVVYLREDGTCARIDFEDAHPRAGEVQHFDATERIACVEFTGTGHPRAGETAYYRDGEHVRTEHGPKSEHHGLVVHLEAGKDVRFEWEAWHPRHGEVRVRDAHGGEWRRVSEPVRVRLEDAGVAAFAEPDELCCPITQELLVDPVVASDGFTYEKSALAALFSKSRSGGKARSPLTRELLDPKVQVPNRALVKRLRSHVDTTLAIAAAAQKKVRS